MENQRSCFNATVVGSGYWRVVKVDLEDGTEYKNHELFATREEAEISCDICQEKWKEHAWDNREYLSMEYQVRFVTFEEVAEEKRQKLEKWRSYVRTTFLDPVVPTTFKTCCQKLVDDMRQRVEKQSKSDICKMRHDGKRLYSPWQTYGAGAKLWACMQLEPGCPKVSYWGMFAKDSLFGSIYKRVEIFGCIEDFKTWLADTNQAAETLEKCMLNSLHDIINSDEVPNK